MARAAQRGSVRYRIASRISRIGFKLVRVGAVLRAGGFREMSRVEEDGDD